MVWVIGIGLALFLVFALPRQMLVVIGMLMVGAAGFFAWLEYTDYRQARDRDSVVLLATFEPEGCTPDYPILVKISNTNAKTLLAVSFSLAGFLQDESAPVYLGKAMASNRVIPPGQSHEQCWSVPRLNDVTAPALLSWIATVSHPTFGTPPLSR